MIYEDNFLDSAIEYLEYGIEMALNPERFITKHFKDLEEVYGKGKATVKSVIQEGISCLKIAHQYYLGNSNHKDFKDFEKHKHFDSMLEIISQETS